MQKKIKPLAVAIIGLVLVPTAPILAAVRVPEYWSGSDWLGFFTLALIAFAMLIRFKVLKPRLGR
jgi:hypothetical protein